MPPFSKNPSAAEEQPGSEQFWRATSRGVEVGGLTGGGGRLAEKVLPDVLVHLRVLVFGESSPFRLFLLPRLLHRRQTVPDGFGHGFGVALVEETRFHLVGGGGEGEGENGVSVGRTGGENLENYFGRGPR